ncbi:uncharacterized protein [Apostichopus japonicus]|uniref:uncharacterized protein n=1 Tax=Stichopus japonicus TaxID=307972 RepID=UPI003AB1182E
MRARFFKDQTSGFNTRQRILTEKGFQYQLGQKEQRFRGIISKWRKHVLKIECLLSERSNLVDVKAERDVLLETMADLSNLYIEVDNLLSTVDQMGSKYSIFEAIEIEHCNLIKRVSEYIHSVTSQGSCSKSSVSAKSHSSTKDEIVTTIAAHEAKLKQIEMKAKFEVQQLELRAKHEAELQRSELAIAKVKLDAIGEQGSVHMDFPDDSLKYTQNYVETLGDVNNPQDRKHLTYEAYLEQPVLRQGVTKFNVPLTGGNNDQPTATRANLGNLTNDFLYQVSLNRLPVPEPEIFSGDPLQYPGWKCAIDLLLENKGIPPSEKIYYLKRYLSGPPKDALEGYFLVPSDSTYIEVRKLLDDRYGNNLAIADAFRSKLEGWPNIQPNDGLALRKFADFLGQCEFAMKLVKDRLSFLNDSWENRKLLDKLPDWLVKRWGRVLSEWDDFPPFGKFRQFIAKEADIACNPLIVSSQKGKGSRGTRGASNFVVETGFDNSSTKLNAHRYKCLICEGDHRLDCCYKFLAKTVEDRKIFVKTKNLCYGCLRQGHISKFCRNRLVCNICSRSHPTALHGDIVSHIGKTVCSSSKSIGIQTEAINTGLSHVSGLRDITMNSLILPVYVSHVDAPQREVLVYALLDTQSDSTFITDKTCELLNVEGSKTLLSLSTLSSKNQLVDSSRIGGLSVRGHREGTKVPLPVSYTCCSIPANRSHIPTPGTARQWPHLKRIANHLMPLEQCEIGLLIGYNCPKALMPIEVISPPDNGPYAERTNLGWGIVGIINPRELSVDKCDPVGVSHFIVTPRPTSEFESILPRDGAKICFKCNVREVVPTQVAGLMELEFNERNFENAYSREDKKFLNILKEGVCQLSDGHYQLPLPMKKSRVVPRRPVTVPRLELTAAVLSVKMSALLKQELEYNFINEYFWSDSQVVLGYNDVKRFHVFVANRVQQIHEMSSSSQWHFIKGFENPSDCASRGLTVDELRTSSWFRGPEMLWQSQLPLVKHVTNLEVFDHDPEVKCCQVAFSSVKCSNHLEVDRLSSFSSWFKARTAIALCLWLKAMLKAKASKTFLPVRELLNVDSLFEAEIEILRIVQSYAFKEELQILRTLSSDPVQCLKKGSPLYALDPFLDENGVICVGGRISKSSFEFKVKHPVIIPKLCHVAELLVRHFHELVAHQGRVLTSNEIRANGYWIIGGSSLIGKVIYKCVTCRRLRGSLGQQKMSDLPVDRVESSPPFTYCGVDCFGPWLVKEGRKELKRYGVLFTCMASRAVHLEVANSLTTDSFLNALRRFQAIRGPVRQLRCDQGTNFVGANNELLAALKEMNQGVVSKSLVELGCDYIEFKFNVPQASHMGGVWERQIKTVRCILDSMLHKLGTQLDDESLRTFMYETTSIINSRPLTTETLYDPLSLEPLTPNHVITLKSKILLPPPGQFDSADMYSRKRWRRVQYLLNVFWSRWRKEYLQNRQVRQKWCLPSVNIEVGDIVLIKDIDKPRNRWPMARVQETIEGNDKCS